MISLTGKLTDSRSRNGAAIRKIHHWMPKFGFYITLESLWHIVMATSESVSLNTASLDRLSIGSQRVGMPRMDPTVRLLHRFYEPLVLLGVLDPTRGTQNANLSADSRSDTLQDLRHKF